MKDWHPATKAVVVLGVVAVIALLLTGDEDSPARAVAALSGSGVGGDSAAAGRVGDSASAQALDGAGDAAGPVLAARALPDEAAITAILERPLFTPTRRPPPEPESSQEESEPESFQPVEDEPPPDVTFVGSLKRDDGILALVSRGYYGGVESVALGEDIDGWEVLEIADHAMLIGRDGRRIEFQIFEAGR